MPAFKKTGQQAAGIAGGPDIPLRRFKGESPTLLRDMASGHEARPAKARKGDYAPVSTDDHDADMSDAELLGRDVVVPQYPAHRRPRRLACGLVLGLVAVGALLLLNIYLMVSQAASGADADSKDPDRILGDWGRPGSGTEGLAWYPTDFLRDVIPIPCHSHNDYWRKVPLFSALHAGCIGIEADVWLSNGDLLVGHDTAALQPNRTFTTLYVSPLVDILKRQNPNTSYYNESRRGVFDTDPGQTLTLLVDVKTDGAATLRKVAEQLQPLRSAGWLTSFHGGQVSFGPVTVVGTGNTPFDVVMENTTHRDVFFDAPLDRLGGSKFDYTNSYYSSTSFADAIGVIWSGRPSEGQILKIRQQVKDAHDRGLKARYWELPSWPVHVRNRLWDTLAKEGVDLLNVDDIWGAARADWSKGM